MLLFFIYEKIFLTFRRKEKKKKRKSRKRESVLKLSTVYSILMPHILLNCTKREITISDIITDRRVKNVWIQQNINLKQSPKKQLAVWSSAPFCH